MNFGMMGFPDIPRFPPAAYLATQSSGIYTVPEGVSNILVLCIAGAGGSSFSSGSGKSLTSRFGTSGGASSFGTVLSAAGGTGAASNVSGQSHSGGAGGVACSILKVSPGMQFQYTVGGGGSSNNIGNGGNGNGAAGTGVGGNIYNRNSGSINLISTYPAGWSSGNAGGIIVLPQ